MASVHAYMQLYYFEDKGNPTELTGSHSPLFCQFPVCGSSCINHIIMTLQYTLWQTEYQEYTSEVVSQQEKSIGWRK